MARKKKKRFDGIVYSTNDDFGYEEDGYEEDTPDPGKQDLRIRLDRLKGNKRATIITGFIGSDDDLKDLGKTLKSRCGVGGSAKDGEIIIQGDMRDKVGKELEKLGYRYKFSGG